jgi:hypothetical protein
LFEARFLLVVHHLYIVIQGLTFRKTDNQDCCSRPQTPANTEVVQARTTSSIPTLGVRSCQTFCFEAKDKKDGAEEASNGDKPKSGTGVTAPNLVQESQSKTAALRDRHQLTIYEDSLAQSKAIDSIPGGTRKKAPKKNRVRRGISLTEHLESNEKGTL